MGEAAGGWGWWVRLLHGVRGWWMRLLVGGAGGCMGLWVHGLVGDSENKGRSTHDNAAMFHRTKL